MAVQRLGVLSLGHWYQGWMFTSFPPVPPKERQNTACVPHLTLAAALPLQHLWADDSLSLTASTQEPPDRLLGPQPTWTQRFRFTSGVCWHSALNFVKYWMMKLADAELVLSGWESPEGMGGNNRDTVFRVKFLCTPQRQLCCHFMYSTNLTCPNYKITWLNRIFFAVQ